MNVDLCLRRFRLASRELFNGYFLPLKDHSSWSDSSVLYASFFEVEQVLFAKLVSEPAELIPVAYGECQREIRVGGFSESDYYLNELLKATPANWDHQVYAFPKDTMVSFVKFVDLEPLKCFDNQLVLVEIMSCPAYPELEGKRVVTQFCSSKFCKL